MTMPTFLVIGAERAGSTTLYHYLERHPQIYMSPVKEPRFFAYESEMPHYNGPGDQEKLPRYTTLQAYQSLFAGVTDETAIGEASVIYLYSPKAPVRIRHYIPDAKLVAILRHPVDRAYSRFWSNLVVQKHEPLTDFAQAMQAEKMRIRDNWHPRWHYKQRGLYYAQLKRYYDIFDREQIHVCLNEDLDADPLGVVQGIYRFLGVNETFEPEMPTRHHAAARGLPKSKTLDDFLTRPNPIRLVIRPLLPTRLRKWLVDRLRVLNTVPRPPLPPEVRAALIEEYREDVLRLEGLIQRDLSAYLI